MGGMGEERREGLGGFEVTNADKVRGIRRACPGYDLRVQAPH